MSFNPRVIQQRSSAVRARARGEMTFMNNTDRIVKSRALRRQRWVETASERGFTLIEATMAILVSVVGLVSLAGMFTMAMKTNKNSQNLTTATTFAQDK